MPYVKVGRAIRGRDYVKTSLTVGVVERGMMADIVLKTGETLSGMVERLVRDQFERIQQNEVEAVLAEQGRVAAAHQKSIEAALKTRQEIDLSNAKKALDNPGFERNPEAWSDPNEPRLKPNGVLVGEVTGEGFRLHLPTEELISQRIAVEGLPKEIKAWGGESGQSGGCLTVPEAG